MDAPLGLTNPLGFRNSQDNFDTQCPRCRADDPGFIDAPVDECPVECESCGHTTILAVWTETAWRARNGAQEVA